MSATTEAPMVIQDAVPLSTGSVVRLAIRNRSSIDVDHALRVLGASTAPWLGERLPDDGEEARRFACDLELGIGDGRRLAFRKSAIVSLGSPEPHGAGWQVPIEWRAATLAPLFPVFVGQLELEPGSLGLVGWYAPPFGEIGVAADRAVLGLGARRVARWFLMRVTGACA